MRTTSKQITASIALVAGMSAGLVNDSQAAEMTGNDLLNLCKKHETSCTWFLFGVADGIKSGEFNVIMNSAVRSDTRFDYSLGTICFPNSWNGQQVRDIFIKYAMENPESRHLGGTYLVSMALQKAWPPCKYE